MVDLEANALIELDSMVFLVLFRIIRVNRMCHISRHKERINV